MRVDVYNDNDEDIDDGLDTYIGDSDVDDEEDYDRFDR